MDTNSLNQACEKVGQVCAQPAWVDSTVIPLVYIVASILFIRGIKFMGKPDTARRGNLESSLGMLLAVLGVLFERGVIAGGMAGYAYVIGAIIVGSVIGIIWAKVVKMTEMPQLVALQLCMMSPRAVFLAHYGRWQKLLMLDWTLICLRFRFDRKRLRYVNTMI